MVACAGMVSGGSCAGLRLCVVTLACAASACSTGRSAPSGAQARWLKGQTHAHTDHSGDGATPAAGVAHWYEARGYDFVVFTDHNFVTGPVEGARIMTFPGVELTQNLETCEPPPPTGLHCILHVNGLFLQRGVNQRVELPPLPGARRLDAYRNGLAAARQRGGIAQLNHPNFHYGADAITIATLAREGLALLEVANQAVDSNNGGDAGHPSTEALWDRILDAGATVWAVASDDAHHFDDADRRRARGEPVFTGDRGFVMVRASPTAEAIREAMIRGDFYASTGVLLADVSVTPTELRIAVDPAARGPHTVRFTGVGGRLLAERRGPTASFSLADARGGYVRAVVEDPRGAKAWVQPVRMPGGDPGVNP